MAGTRENRRVVRVALPTPVQVVIGSLGSPVKYTMFTSNVSTTGLFLDYERPSRFPFTPATILEVWVQLAPEKVVFFNGKVARTVKSGETTSTSGPGIGIHIVQMEKETEVLWREFIETTARQQRDNTTHVA